MNFWTVQGSVAMPHDWRGSTSSRSPFPIGRACWTGATPVRDHVIKLQPAARTDAALSPAAGSELRFH